MGSGWSGSRRCSALPTIIASLKVLGFSRLERSVLRCRVRRHGATTDGRFCATLAAQQIQPDGVGAEQSTAYTGVVLEMLLLGLAIARALSQTVPERYVGRSNRLLLPGYGGARTRRATCRTSATKIMHASSAPIDWTRRTPIRDFPALPCCWTNRN